MTFLRQLFLNIDRFVASPLFNDTDKTALPKGGSADILYEPLDGHKQDMPLQSFVDQLIVDYTHNGGCWFDYAWAQLKWEYAG